MLPALLIPAIGIAVVRGIRAISQARAEAERDAARAELKAAKRAVKRQARKARRDHLRELDERIAALQVALDSCGLDRGTRRALTLERARLAERRSSRVRGSELER